MSTQRQSLVNIAANAQQMITPDVMEGQEGQIIFKTLDHVLSPVPKNVGIHQIMEEELSKISKQNDQSLEAKIDIKEGENLGTQNSQPDE